MLDLQNNDVFGEQINKFAIQTTSYFLNMQMMTFPYQLLNSWYPHAQNIKCNQTFIYLQSTPSKLLKCTSNALQIFSLESTKCSLQNLIFTCQEQIAFRKTYIRFCSPCYNNQEAFEFLFSSYWTNVKCLCSNVNLSNTNVDASLTLRNKVKSPWYICDWHHSKMTWMRSPAGSLKSARVVPLSSFPRKLISAFSMMRRRSKPAIAAAQKDSNHQQYFLSIIIAFKSWISLKWRSILCYQSKSKIQIS